MNFSKLFIIRNYIIYNYFTINIANYVHCQWIALTLKKFSLQSIFKNNFKISYLFYYIMQHSFC
jgi:hypothetical protein